jgi:hypothetical protein
MDKVIAVFGRSITKMLGMFSGGIAMTGVCALVAFHVIPDIPPDGRAELVGYAGFLFFGLASTIIFTRLFSTSAMLEVSTSGIRDRRRSTVLIPWSAIAKVSIRDDGTRQSLVLQFRPDERAILKALRLDRRLGNLNDVAGARVFSISMKGLDGSFDDLINAIKKAEAVSAREAWPSD